MACANPEQITVSGPLLPLHLAAEDLWSRHGFGDGRPFSFEDRGPGFDDASPDPSYVRIVEETTREQRDDLLAALIERHLLPAIEVFTGETPAIGRIGTHHNTVRDRRFLDDHAAVMPLSWYGISVVVAPEDILEMLDGITDQCGIAARPATRPMPV